MPVLLIQGGAAPAAYFGAVEYTPAGVAESTTETIDDERILDHARRHEALAEYVDLHYEDFFFLKSDDFATEYEWRVVLMSEGLDFAYVDYQDALFAVVLGERFPKWQLPGARDVCHVAGVQMRTIHWEQGRPVALPDTERSSENEP